MWRRTLLLSVLALATCAPAATAMADGPVGPDPSTNFHVGQLPDSCRTAPASPSCIAAVVSELDQARASLRQGPYGLPADFASLTAAEQAFVLTDSDRVLYGLAPIPGLTSPLAKDASGGVRSDYDPTPSDPRLGSYTSNWAGGFVNMPLAYEAWMYDDGPGSGNEDCTAGNSSGCWGHRHDILWQFTGPGALAMGAAAGTDSSGDAGYAMMLAQGDGGYHPAYTYTWSQAVADGARATSAVVPAPISVRPAPMAAPRAVSPVRVKISIASLQVRARTVSIRITATRGAALACALTRLGRGWGADHFRRCWPSTTYSALRSGRYRLRARSAGVVASRYFVVR
jgi:hypothetical protein